MRGTQTPCSSVFLEPRPLRLFLSKWKTGCDAFFRTCAEGLNSSSRGQNLLAYTLEESAAHWRSWACLSSYRQKVDSHPYEKVAAATDVSEGSGTDGLPNNLDSFIVILNIHIETYFRYALPLTYIKCEKELRFFKSLVCKRTEEFVRETRCQASGVPGKSLWRSETTTCFSLDGRLRRVEK